MKTASFPWTQNVGASENYIIPVISPLQAESTNKGQTTYQ
jgi:hypothetical protein